MPDWVAKQIEMDDYVGYLKAPVGTWDGKTYRLSIDGDCHTFSYRTDVFSDAALAEAWKAEGGQGEWGVPKTWQQVQAVTKFLKGKQVNGQDVFGYLDAPKAWGGFGFYFLGSRATAYAKHPDDKAWLFDPETMKPRVNNPAWVRAIQDVIDALPSEPPDQLNADPNQTAFVAVPRRHRLDAVVVGRRRLQRQDQRRFGGRRRHRLLDPARLRRRLQHQDRRHGTSSPAARTTRPTWPISAGAFTSWRAVDSDEKKHKAAWSCAAHLAGKDISLWMAAYPSGFQPYRNSHFNIPEWVAAGYDEAFISSYLFSNRDSYNHPNAAIEPRIPGIFQYYSIAEDELAKIFAGQSDAQKGADNIAAAWEKITDQIGRDNQIKLYKASLGM